MTRHANADTSPVTIERSDAMDAAGALVVAAERARREARRRCWAGPRWAAMRADLVSTAAVFEAAAVRVQRATEA